MMAAWKDTPLPAARPGEPARQLRLHVVQWWELSIDPAHDGCGMVRSDGVSGNVYLGTSAGCVALLRWNDPAPLADLVYWALDVHSHNVLLEWPGEKARLDIAEDYGDLWAAFMGEWDEDDLVGADFDDFADGQQHVLDYPGE